MQHRVVGLAVVWWGVVAVGLVRGGPDVDADGLSDVWEVVFGAGAVAAGDDSDGDGYSNVEESIGGTDPFDPFDHLGLEILPVSGERLMLRWEAVAGKRYVVEASDGLAAEGGWEAEWASLAAGGGRLEVSREVGGVDSRFYRLAVADEDADGDGVSTADELAIGYDPARARTGRFPQDDGARLESELAAASVVSVSVYDDRASERWPDPILFVVRRRGGIAPLSVPVAFSGSAVAGVDFVVRVVGGEAGSVSVPAHVAVGPGQREVFVELVPLIDGEDGEPDESVVLEAGTGEGYVLGAAASAAAVIENEPAGGRPRAKEAARFLIQAAFGPDQDAPEDPDIVPENVEAVMELGFDAWIDDQFDRPIGRLQPFVEWAEANRDALQIYNDTKMDAWWGRAMGLPKLRPDATETQAPDPLRQRVAYCLSQIFVISDRMEDLAVSPVGMANYYDLLLEHSFGNFRDLLRGVALHPCMGLYLSHLGNRKPDPANNIFPDENFAREIMQLFSIGLWELNPDGTARLDASGHPIPAYDNRDITEFARVFTGLAFGGSNTAFGLWPRDFTRPMKAWDAEHDLEPKRLLRGAVTPRRTAGPADSGSATMADVEAAIDNLFHHPNVGPFIGRQLIQRLVTSNPSPAYVARVAGAFADNGSGERGDMKAVVRAILLDPESREPGFASAPGFGKLREPFLRCVNVARAFNAWSPAGWYYLDAFALDHGQEPMKAPSVFNFYLPNHSPPGALADAGLAAPEMQIINASTAVTAPNYFWNAITGGLHRWGTGNPNYAARLDLDQEMLLNVPPSAVDDPYPAVPPLDPDPLLRRLDLVLTGGTLDPRQFQLIREALDRIGPGSGWEWPRNRLKLAIYLIVASPDFCVLR